VGDRTERLVARTGRSSTQLVIAAVGIVLLAAAVVVPFGEVDAGCLDHCAEHKLYYAWLPLHNPGALFLVPGVAGMLARMRRPPRRVGRWWAAAASGALGIWGLGLAPAILAELELYGSGQDVEYRWGATAAVAGYVFLVIGTYPVVPTAGPDPAAPSDAGTAPGAGVSR
jgi:hypothetical protein